VNNFQLIGCQQTYGTRTRGHNCQPYANEDGQVSERQWRHLQVPRLTCVNTITKHTNTHHCSSRQEVNWRRRIRENKSAPSPCSEHRTSRRSSSLPNRTVAVETATFRVSERENKDSKGCHAAGLTSIRRFVRAGKRRDSQLHICPQNADVLITTVI
jgi:hypothetical protein